MERALAAMAMELTPTQAHANTNMHTHAQTRVVSTTMLLLDFTSTLID